MTTQRERLAEARALTPEEKKWFDDRLDRGAYYFGFKKTGIIEIDRILGAVCAAGKGYHHTEQWSEPTFEDDASYCDLIQAAADDAARAWLAHDDKERDDDRPS